MAQQPGRPQAPATGALGSTAGVAGGSQPAHPPGAAARRQPWLTRLQNSRNGLGFTFMLPAGLLLLLFLSYPLGLGVWLGFTDAKIGRGGAFIGLENYVFLFG